MSVKFQELPGWDFHIQEVSVGVYRATGSDHLGHRTVAEGLDPDACLEECRSAALKIETGRRDGRPV